MEDRRTVVDHIDGIDVSTEAHHHNLTVLQSLDIGLFRLAESTRQYEVEALERFGRENTTGLFHFGSPQELWLGCMFDWFAISLVSYMRTVQLMNLMETNGWGLEDLKRKSAKQKLRDASNAYINRVAPDALEWRNKIAAHRAATNPMSDSLALLTYSTMPTVGYHSPYYCVGHITLTLWDGSSAALPQWSLTQKYEELASRYWPDRKLTELDW